MTYQPDLRDQSWLGYRGHKHARPHEQIKAQERERARKSAEDAKRKARS